jgi:8-amino-7-oxononanoate synthase
MSDFNQELGQQLNAIRAEGLYRELRQVDSPQGSHIHIKGRPLLNFSSNDYLGLANHPALQEAACKAIERFGAGSGASRLICGSLAPHHQLEEALAQFKGAEAALSFSSGYAAALGTIGALLNKDDIIIIDKLVHASIVDAARLCGATLRIFAHDDMGELEDILKWANTRGQSATPQQRKKRILIVTESVFSMDGNLVSLRDIVELKNRHGAWLMLDEAHATGLFGQHRRGLAEAFELGEAVEIQMGTLGKALGSAGGYICGSRPLIEMLINRGRSFIFSTAPPPAAAAAATAAVHLVQSDEGEERRSLLWARVDQAKNGLVGGPWEVPVVRSAIIPLIIGGESQALDLAAELGEMGIFIPAIRYPTVARGKARLRLTLSAAHNPVDIAALLGAFDICKSRARVESASTKTGNEHG